ncbi:response regulator [Candidatus Nitrospira bockiana]
MPLRILVVDDEELIRRLIPEAIRRQLPDVVIETAESGRDALTHLRSHPYHVVISDVGMPHGDGFFLLEEIKRDWPHLPVILMSGEAREEEARERGAQAFLPKPLNLDQLIRIVQALRGRRIRVIIRRDDSPR